MLDFDSMNETDVREIVVRPMLERLGYRHGTEANIRTELTLKYDRAFLGRRNPRKDPPLVGRADYICEVISFGRWVVEVKAPSQELTDEVVQQAHTYAAHPEVAAGYFMVTNGREFRVYQTGKLDAPTMAWRFEKIEESLLGLFNLLGPDAVRKRAKLGAADLGKPLGRGVASKVLIVGGEIVYDDHKSDNPLFPAETINGLRLPVTGGSVQRSDDGRIHAHVDVANAAALFRGIAEMMGAGDGYEFYSAAEYISDDPESPTIFQNLFRSNSPAGAPVSVPGLGQVPLPFTMDMVAVTEAIGFVDGDVFKGTMHLSYDCTITNMSPQVRAAMELRLGKIPAKSQFEGGGRFEVRLQNAA